MKWRAVSVRPNSSEYEAEKVAPYSDDIFASILGFKVDMVTDATAELFDILTKISAHLPPSTRLARVEDVFAEIRSNYAWLTTNPQDEDRIMQWNCSAWVGLTTG